MDTKRKKVLVQFNVLISLAMQSNEKLHIEIAYKPHVNWIEYSVIHASNDYSRIDKPSERYLLDGYIRLVEDGALAKMLELEDKIIDLLGEC